MRLRRAVLESTIEINSARGAVLEADRFAGRLSHL